LKDLQMKSALCI